MTNSSTVNSTARRGNIPDVPHERQEESFDSQRRRRRAKLGVVVMHRFH